MMFRIVTHLFGIAGVMLLTNSVAHAAQPMIRLEVGGAEATQVSSALKMIVVLTVLTMAPAILMTTTSFVRIAVVFAFLKNALGVQNMPPQQVLMGLSLFLTLAIMAPIGEHLYTTGIEPYMDGKIPAQEAIDVGTAPLRDFMLRQTREADLALFYEIGQVAPPEHPSEVRLRLLIPAFIISELRTAFEMGFLLFAPFLVLDLIVASILMAMGMIMLPPALISLPIKIILFILADGWNMLVGSLVRSFG